MAINEDSQMLEQMLARNFSGPLNNYVNQNLSLGIQRAQQEQAYARQAAAIQDQRAFQREQALAGFANQRTLQNEAKTFAATKQREYLNAVAAERQDARDDKAKAELVREAQEAMTDELMQGYDPRGKTPQEIVEERQRRQGDPNFSDDLYAKNASASGALLASAQRDFDKLTGGAGEKAKVQALKATLLDPVAQKTLLDNGITSKEITDLLSSDVPTIGAFRELAGKAGEKSRGFWDRVLGRSGSRDEVALGLQGLYQEKLAGVAGIDAKDPRLIPISTKYKIGSEGWAKNTSRIKNPEVIGRVSKELEGFYQLPTEIDDPETKKAGTAQNAAITAMMANPGANVQQVSPSPSGLVAAGGLKGVVSDFGSGVSRVMTQAPVADSAALEQARVYSPQNALGYNIRQGLNGAWGGVEEQAAAKAMDLQRYNEAAAILNLPPVDPTNYFGRGF